MEKTAPRDGTAKGTLPTAEDGHREPDSNVSSVLVDVPRMLKLPSTGNYENEQRASDSEQQEVEAKWQCEVLNVSETYDLSEGRWVFDDVSYPIYKEHECQFLTEQVTCMRNDRRDDLRKKPEDPGVNCTGREGGLIAEVHGDVGYT
ncbi:hypothetical protein Cni_G10991 [Canna indica]|uniref:Trichome birefringence-like N-terminal domain-containing protein n=1 Tax=Canna indica TaxID=4628 RepID=A0AAQ3K585_9LILI|nr:hypothetical protein Cni_G10991 [Canna indica]